MLIGEAFYSNGVDTYEFFSKEMQEPAGYIVKEEVEFLMFKEQLDNPRRLILEKDNICKKQCYWEVGF